MSATRAVRIDAEEVVSLAARLIEIESHCDAPAREAGVARHLVRWFADRGITADRIFVDGDRANVIARLRGGDGPTWMLCGHLDTVPAGAMPDAFSPRIEDGLLWGRGAADMKGAVAAMCATLAALRRADVSLPGDVVFAGTVDEETGGLGVRALVDAGVRAERAVVGEPTSLRIAPAHKGAAFVRIHLTGRGAHGSRPECGVNAVSHAARIVVALEESFRPRLAERLHPLLGSSTVNVGRVCGGTQPNIVAERCEIDVDRRTVPGEPPVLPEISDWVESACGGVDGLTIRLEELPWTSIVPHVPLGTDPDSAAVQAATAACRALGVSDTLIGLPYWTDGAHLGAHGIETIVLGPGDIAHAHGPREHVRVADLERAAALYTAIVCSRSPAA